EGEAKVELLEEVDGEDVVGEDQAQDDADDAAQCADEERFEQEGSLDETAVTAKRTEHANLLTTFDDGPGAGDGEGGNTEKERHADHAQEYVAEQDAWSTC